ncbi:PREDICTED: uncharacterized protein LOC109476178 [Branchiostoma belcheri]|uniref:Uncharacterized protein LOC109476178 n=1 Tax=Branchiostoma belcheri TaxID=7741 RepID=A0A6P4ZSN7_BRABE|nr:PREDICTED: uncharacterized protein LOC109476178 [Branchiostoma belcheri]
MEAEENSEREAFPQMENLEPEQIDGERCMNDVLQANDDVLRRHSIHHCFQGELEAISPKPESLRFRTDTDGITLELSSLLALRPPSDVFIATKWWKHKCYRKLIDKMSPLWQCGSAELREYRKHVPGLFLCSSLSGTNVLLCAGLKENADPQTTATFFEDLGTTTLGQWFCQRVDNLLRRTWDELRLVAPESHTLLNNMVGLKLSTGTPLRVYRSDWIHFATAFDNATGHYASIDGEACPFEVKILIECFGQKMSHSTTTDASQLDEDGVSPDVDPLKTLVDLRLRREFVERCAVHIGVSVGLQDPDVSTLWHRNLRYRLFPHDWQMYSVMGMDSVANITTRKDRKPTAVLNCTLVNDTFDLTFAQAYNPISTKMSGGWEDRLTNGLPVTLAAASGVAIRKATKSTQDFVKSAIDGTIQGCLHEIVKDVNPHVLARFEVVLTCEGENLSEERTNEQVKHLVAALRQELSGTIPVVIPVHSNVLREYASDILTQLAKPIHVANVGTTQWHSRNDVVTIAICEVLLRLLLVGRVEARERAYLHSLGINPERPWEGFCSLTEPDATAGWKLKEEAFNTWAREAVLTAPPWYLPSYNDSAMFRRMHETILLLRLSTYNEQGGRVTGETMAEIYWKHVKKELTAIMLSRNMRVLTTADGGDALFDGTIEGRGVRVTGKIKVEHLANMLCDVETRNLPRFCTCEAVIGEISRLGISTDTLRQHLLEVIRADAELSTFPYVQKRTLNTIKAGLLIRVQGGEHVNRDVCLRAHSIVSGDFGARVRQGDLGHLVSWVILVINRLESVCNENTTALTNCLAYVSALVLQQRGFQLDISAVKAFRTTRKIPVRKLQQARILSDGMEGRLNRLHEDILTIAQRRHRRRPAMAERRSSTSSLSSDETIVGQYINGSRSRRLIFTDED